MLVGGIGWHDSVAAPDHAITISPTVARSPVGDFCLATLLPAISVGWGLVGFWKPFNFIQSVQESMFPE